MIRIAGADHVAQFGFDETGIDRASTMNQWVAIKSAAGEVTIVNVETGGILVGGTAQECADHIKETWRRGQRGVELVRSELIAEHGVEVADALVPMKNGGVMLLKIGSAIHDTCNTANARK